MAFTNFYMQTTGNDVNAGTSTANVADVTSTNGDWDNAAPNRFTAAAGTPFSGVTTNDWASIYLDGATVAVFVAKVTAINAGGASIDVSATSKIGTKPLAGATGRSCKINGAWASEQVLAAGGLASATVGVNAKINIKSGTYTVTASRTIAMTGTATETLWFSGYNATIGDLDGDTSNALAKPLFSLNAGFSWTTNGARQIWSGLSVTGNINQAVWLASNSDYGKYVRLRIQNTNAGTNAEGIQVSGGGGTTVAYCWAKTPTTATGNGVFVATNGSVVMLGCVAEGGGYAGFRVAGAGPASINLLQCVAQSNTGQGMIVETNAQTDIMFCTINNPTGDGIRFTAAPGYCTIVGCLLSNCGGYGINQNTGTNTDRVFRSANDFYNNTSGAENGFGDMPSFFGQTDTSAVVTSPTDMTPVSGSNARNNGFPGIFENESYSSYADIGAVRHQDPAGAGGGAAIFGA